MKFHQQLIKKAGGLAVASVTRAWMSTLDFKACIPQPETDPVNPAFCGPKIFIFWHEYITFPFYLRGHCNIAMLLSRHQDAEWLSEAARHMGFQTVRGSTARGGVAAIRKMFRKSQNMNLAITPDGPRGPRRRLAPGAVFLASKLEIPIVALGLGFDRPKRLGTWDRFAVPRPYSRSRAILSPEIYIPAGLDRHELEEWRLKVEQELNTVTTRAEHWAESGIRLADQMAVKRQPAPLQARRRAA